LAGRSGIQRAPNGPQQLIGSNRLLKVMTTPGSRSWSGTRRSRPRPLRPDPWSAAWPAPRHHAYEACRGPEEPDQTDLSRVWTL